MKEPKTEERKLTPEELAKRKEDLTRFYTDQIGFLKIQVEYEDLLTRIEESRTRRGMAIIRMAEMMSGPEPETEPKKDEILKPIVEDPGTSKETVFRTLKTEKV